MDATTDAQSSSTLRVNKGKGKEVAPSSELGSSTPRVDKGKAREVNPPFDSSAFGQRLADEEIISPGAAAAAQHRLAGLRSTGSILGGMGSMVLQPNKLWPDWGLNPGLLDIYQVLYH